jgi:hypothetical protein
MVVNLGEASDVVGIVVGIAICATFGLQLTCFIQIRILRRHATDFVVQSAEVAAKAVSKEISTAAAAAAVIAADELLKRSTAIPVRKE